MRKLYVFGGLIFGVILFVFKATFCNAASIAVDPSAGQSILNGVNAFGSGSFNFSTMNPAMLPALYDNINLNLYQTFGYDVNDAIDYGADNLTSWATGQRDNPLNGASTISVSTADWLASKLLQAGATASSILHTGYEYFAQSIPQWGENAKQFFIGKKNEISGAIESVGANFVTKVTAGGLVAYNQIYNNLVNNDDIHNMSLGTFFYGNNLYVDYYSRSSTHNIVKINFSNPCYIYSNGSARADLWCLIDSSLLQFDSENNIYYLPCNGIVQLDYDIYNIHYLVYQYDYFHTINIDSKTYFYGPFAFTSSITGGWITSMNNVPYQFGSYSDVINNLTQNPSSAVSYDYSSTALSQALKEQLERLIGKYVDSITLEHINDIISSIPIGQEVVDDVSVPVAIPTQEVVDELTDVIDDAITDSATYEEVFDAFYEEAIDVPDDPDPDPSGAIEPYINIDPPLPPIETVSEVLTIPFKLFTSIFEPIFLVFGGSLFGLWLFIPVIILFIILIWALK